MLPFVSWSTAILVEPMIVHRNDKNELLLRGARKRLDVWSGREEASKYLRERLLKSWDPRVADIFVVCTISYIFCTCALIDSLDGQKYGLRELPTLTYPDKTQGVTLSCTKAQEVVRDSVVHQYVPFNTLNIQATYGENVGRFKALKFLATFCKEVPTHVIFGEIADIKCVLYFFGLRIRSLIKFSLVRLQIANSSSKFLVTASGQRP